MNKRALILLTLVFLLMSLCACREEWQASLEENSDIGNDNSNADTTTASYLGTWEIMNSGYEETNELFTITDSEIVISFTDEDGEVSASGPFSYTVSKDQYYTYLELDNPFDDPTFDMVLVWISEGTMAMCSTDLENSIPEDWSGTQSYSEHIGTTPTGTKYYGGSCGLLVRQDAIQTTIPSHADRSAIANLLGANIEDLDTAQCLYYQDSSILVVIVSIDWDGEIHHNGAFMYVKNDGDIIYVESVGIKYLNGYQEDDIFTDHNIVITDHR